MTVREQSFLRELENQIQSVRDTWRTQPLVLGGSSGSGGGSGGAPGGTLGQLSQRYIAADSDEFRTLTSGSNSSLLDNLNNIRYWQETQISATEPSPTFVGQLWIDESSGSVLKVRDESDAGWITVASGGGGGVLDPNAPIDVGASAIVGSSGSSAHGNHVHRGVTGVYTAPNTNAYGDVELVGSPNLTVTQSSGSFTFATSGSFVPIAHGINDATRHNGFPLTAANGGLGTTTVPQQGDVPYSILGTTYSPVPIAGGANVTVQYGNVGGGRQGIIIASSGSGIVSASVPLFVSAGVNPNITIQNAAADGATKGAATFAPLDFESVDGCIFTDYTNGQAASSTAKGFLTSADWNTFNNKVGGLTPFATVAPLDVAGTASIGSSGSVPHADHVHRGVSGVHVAPNSDLYGSVELVGSTNISLTQSSGSVTFASSGSFTPSVHGLSGAYHAGILTPAMGGTGINNSTNTLTIPTSGTAALGAGQLSSTSPNDVSSGSHTHQIDSSLARSAITVTGSGALGGGGALTSNQAITLNTPGTLNTTSTNSSASAHTHEITNSAAPGAAASLLASDASGNLTLAGQLKVTTANSGYINLIRPVTAIAATTDLFGSPIGYAGTIRRMHVTCVVNTTNNSSNYWQFLVYKLSDSSNLVTTCDTKSIAAATMATVSTTGLSAAVATADIGLFFRAVKVGSPGNLDLYGLGIYIE